MGVYHSVEEYGKKVLNNIFRAGNPKERAARELNNILSIAEHCKRDRNVHRAWLIAIASKSDSLSIYATERLKHV